MYLSYEKINMRSSNQQSHLSLRLLLFAALYIAIGIFNVGCSDSTENTSFSMIISEGALSNISVQRFDIIRDSVALVALWTIQNLGFAGVAEIPVIDFNQDMILALFLGSRISGGFTIKVESIEELSTQMIINILESVPGTGCPVTLGFTQPFQIVKIPKTDKTIVFQIRSATFNCNT